jgi:hypothetical protein
MLPNRSGGMDDELLAHIRTAQPQQEEASVGYHLMR